VDKDRIKGKMNEVKGRMERQVGEWTGDEESEAKGAMDQVKGKAQNAFGKMKDAGRDAADKFRRNKEHAENRRDKDEAA
jgi:uncharacterized protein YjbJ (UPF0337 family)